MVQICSKNGPNIVKILSKNEANLGFLWFWSFFGPNLNPFFRFHVRAPTFFQQCRDQQWYIHQLQALQAGYSSQIADIKEQLANQLSRSGNF